MNVSIKGISINSDQVIMLRRRKISVNLKFMKLSKIGDINFQKQEVDTMWQLCFYQNLTVAFGLMKQLF